MMTTDTVDKTTDTVDKTTDTVDKTTEFVKNQQSLQVQARMEKNLTSTVQGPFRYKEDKTTRLEARKAAKPRRQRDGYVPFGQLPLHADEDTL